MVQKLKNPIKSKKKPGWVAFFKKTRVFSSPALDTKSKNLNFSHLLKSALKKSISAIGLKFKLKPEDTTL